MEVFDGNVFSILSKPYAIATSSRISILCKMSDLVGGIVTDISPVLSFVTDDLKFKRIK